ncbi:hypothetical protein, partial [Propylenella binzhouense]|uniref:hypothetical protein n=1 Tax=Propylenella binzhouense TaxID=2555902 RepID=UPI00136D80E7
GRGRRAAVLGGAALAAVLALLLATDVKRGFVAPADPALVAAIRALPKDAVVAGFSDDLNFSPLLTNRSTLFNRELAVGYHAGYFRPLMARVNDLRDAVLTHDPAVLAGILERYRIDLLVVPRAMLADPRIPRFYRGLFGPDLAAREAAAASGGPTALARFASECMAGSYSYDVALQAGCLIGAARAAPR